MTAYAKADALAAHLVESNALPSASSTVGAHTNVSGPNTPHTYCPPPVPALLLTARYFATWPDTWSLHCDENAAHCSNVSERRVA